MTGARPPGALHFVCGSTGAGKTSYAIRLADRMGALRFSIDEWMAALFWPDSPQPIDPAWAMERVERCAALIWRTAADASRRGAPAVLEIGLTTRASRDRYAELAREAGLPAQLHFLDVPADERWRRVEARNRAGGELGFAISRAMFDYVEGMWEAPDTGELAAWKATRIG